MSRLRFLQTDTFNKLFFLLSVMLICVSLPSCTKPNLVKISGSEYGKIQNQDKSNAKSNYSDSNLVEKHDKTDDSNVLKISENEINANDTVVVKNDAQEIVEEKLAKPFKTLNVAIIAPISGKYSTIGSVITETAMLYSANTQYQNTMNINVYNIGKLSGKNWQDQSEVKRLINDGNDVVIGSVFADTTEKLLSILPKEVLFITFLNDANFIKKNPNLIVSSIDDSFRFLSLFEYLNDSNRRFLSLLLPTTKAGYNVDKIIKRLAKNNHILIISSQFYQPRNQQSISAAVRNMKNAFRATYMIDENGEFVTKNVKINKKNKYSNQNKNYDKVSVTTNSIYIESNDEDLETIIASFDQNGILDKNIQFFTNAIVNFDKSIINDLEQINFIGYNYNIVNKFNDKFKQKFSHFPNYFSYMTNDTLAVINYLSNETSLKPSDVYGDNGFRGVLDEFRFARSGHIERRMSIYELKNGKLIVKYTPDYYYRINNKRSPAEQIYIKDESVYSKSV